MGVKEEEISDPDSTTNKGDPQSQRQQKRKEDRINRGKKALRSY